MTAKQAWNPELYEARHAFVWELGQGILELLRPEKGERILDVGCGTGQLTRRIADSGAEVTGLDSSPDMIGQARQNYPGLRFILADAASMQFAQNFDAIFSNAALHWMLDAQQVARAMARALRPNGRLTAELGGKGNIAHIEAALDRVLPRYYVDSRPALRTYFPSVAEYSEILEAAGFEVRLMHLFDRPTPLEGEQGMENWLRQFSWYNFEPLAGGERDEALAEVLEQLRSSQYSQGQWYVDYRRLRLNAVKL